MGMHDDVQFLRGNSPAEAGTEHPIIELSDEELRIIVGGIEGGGASSSMTGSFNGSAPLMCCDGTVVCCCIK